jgi:hypothetical protein
MDLQHFVEVRRAQIAGVGLDRHRFDALLPERRIAATEARQVCDARDFEPNQVLSVVHDALRVGLGEADANLRVEVEAVDGETLEV